jgi:hypothetical protein
MQFKVNVDYLLPESTDFYYEADSVADITDEVIIEHLDLPVGTKIEDFTITNG